MLSNDMRTEEKMVRNRGRESSANVVWSRKFSLGDLAPGHYVGGGVVDVSKWGVGLVTPYRIRYFGILIGERLSRDSKLQSSSVATTLPLYHFYHHLMLCFNLSWCYLF